MEESLSAISSAMSEAIAKEYLADEDIEEVKRRLGEARNGLDAFHIQGFVQGIAKDPCLKIPPPVTTVNLEPGEIEKHLQFVADSLGRPLGRTEPGGSYMLDDNGKSILFFAPYDNNLVTGCTRQELTMYLMMAGEGRKETEYFINLFGLQGVAEDYRAVGRLSKRITDLLRRCFKRYEGDPVKEMRESIENDRAICDLLQNLPRIPEYSGPRPLFDTPRSEAIIQGDGRMVDAGTTDMAWTFGLGPCVAVSITQNGKAFLAHIDSFDVHAASLGGRCGKEQLEDALENFRHDSSLGICLAGASEGGGRSTVLAIYKFLRERGLEDNIKAANVLAAGVSSAMFVSVKTGGVFAG